MRRCLLCIHTFLFLCTSFPFLSEIFPISPRSWPNEFRKSTYLRIYFRPPGNNLLSFAPLLSPPPFPQRNLGNSRFPPPLLIDCRKKEKWAATGPDRCSKAGEINFIKRMRNFADRRKQKWPITFMSERVNFRGCDLPPPPPPPFTIPPMYSLSGPPQAPSPLAKASTIC